MAKYIFEEEEDLGKVVRSTKPFCTLAPSREIVDVKQLTEGICGTKFSKLCGFTFRSTDSNSTKFLVVYCPKARHNFVRGQVGLSGWYCWMPTGEKAIEIMPREDMMQKFGFNVDKFFQSDLFAKMLPVFVKQTKAAIATSVKRFLDSMEIGDYDRVQAKFMVKCAEASLSRIGDVTEIASVGSGRQECRAKLAYNADSRYSLDMKARECRDCTKFGHESGNEEEQDD